ncbi:MAG: NUDIX hydrolase [Bacteroidales bacterium]|nr:NUDIX hydrolase [Bacteroidales bacterium]
MSKYTYDYPRPAVTVDIILFAFTENDLKTLLIKRKEPPFQGHWAYPGGFVDENETAEEAAIRELKEETNLTGIELNQLFANSNLNRDPRGRTVSVVFYGFVPFGGALTLPGDDAEKAQWYAIDKMPKLAFDHKLLHQKSIEKCTDLLRFKVFGKEVLPKQFNLYQLMEVYHKFLSDQNKVQFLTKKLFELKVITVVDDKQSIFSFNESNYQLILENGIHLS